MKSTLYIPLFAVNSVLRQLPDRTTTEVNTLLCTRYAMAMYYVSSVSLHVHDYTVILHARQVTQPGSNYARYAV